jgi:hypothetical protein
MNSWVTALRSVCTALANSANSTNHSTPVRDTSSQISKPPPQISKGNEEEQKVGLDDFEIKKVVGKGSFGKV